MKSINIVIVMLLVLIVSVSAQDNCLILSQDELNINTNQNQVNTDTIVVKNICNVTKIINIDCSGEICQFISYNKEIKINYNQKIPLNISILISENNPTMKKIGYLTIGDNKLNISTVYSNDMVNVISNELNRKINIPFLVNSITNYVYILCLFALFSLLILCVSLILELSGMKILMLIGLGLFTTILYIFINIINHYNL